MRFDLDFVHADGEASEAQTRVPTGAPLMLALQDIDEDPNQPRREFDNDALLQLAATIAERGVRQPVSVRPNPELPDRWILNFGARRLRASRLAGKTEIPAFVDQGIDSYDQVIENEQREPLRPMELALFVGRQLATGQTQADVARRLGKTRAYISYVSALIDPPDWLTTLYREGRCRGVKELYDLRRLHDAHTGEVESWASGRDFISRGDVEALREYLQRSQPEQPSAATTASAKVPRHEEATSQREVPRARERLVQTETQRIDEGVIPLRSQVAVLAEHEGDTVRVATDHAPDDDGAVFVTNLGGTDSQIVKVESLQRLRLVRVASDEDK